MFKKKARAPEGSNKAPRSGGRRGPIRASEIGTFLYCQRAWWYQRQGIPSENLALMRGGSELHQEHGRKVWTAGLFRIAGYALLLTALVVLTIYWIGKII